ncbi:hypothetical protein B0O99DRAFT_643658 [Bisporella sp. PMI_857]|nr:hypothetical protein B0O99DRAFT_643658 [Bisporella sp. PMI_857]
MLGVDGILQAWTISHNRGNGVYTLGRDAHFFGFQLRLTPGWDWLFVVVSCNRFVGFRISRDPKSAECKATLLGARPIRSRTLRHLIN